MGDNSKIHKWLYSDELSGKFLMLPPELFEEKSFQNLSHAARLLYVTLCTHYETDIQRRCLYLALQEYNRIYGLGMSEQDILDESMPNKRTKYIKGYFVAPQKHLEAYGYSKNYAAKLKKELIEHGFIKPIFGKKGKYNAWDKNVTVYQFSNDWKTKHSSQE